MVSVSNIISVTISKHCNKAELCINKIVANSERTKCKIVVYIATSSKYGTIYRICYQCLKFEFEIQQRCDCYWFNFMTAEPKISVNILAHRANIVNKLSSEDSLIKKHIILLNIEL
jgi:hypothetical protein